MNTRSKIILSLVLICVISTSLLIVHKTVGLTPSYSETESEPEDATEDFIDEDAYLHPRLRGLTNWKRPEGPIKIALQAGHLNAKDAPEEFPNLRERTGTSGGGTTEWQTNLKIAEETKKLLDAKGYSVEILPATIPPNYYADIFVSIHADGNLNTNVNGFKVASPRRDHTNKASLLAQSLQNEYQTTTKLALDPNITRNMTGYYAFNWRRYEHSLHPMTVGAIIETGFLTNPNDRKTIVNKPQTSALGIVNGIEKYLALNK